MRGSAAARAPGAPAGGIGHGTMVVPRAAARSSSRSASCWMARIQSGAKRRPSGPRTAHRRRSAVSSGPCAASGQPAASRTVPSGARKRPSASGATPRDARCLASVSPFGPQGMPARTVSTATSPVSGSAWRTRTGASAEEPMAAPVRARTAVPSAWTRAPSRRRMAATVSKRPPSVRQTWPGVTRRPRRWTTARAVLRKVLATRRGTSAPRPRSAPGSKAITRSPARTRSMARSAPPAMSTGVPGRKQAGARSNRASASDTSLCLGRAPKASGSASSRRSPLAPNRMLPLKSGGMSCPAGSNVTGAGSIAPAKDSSGRRQFSMSSATAFWNSRAVAGRGPRACSTAPASISARFGKASIVPADTPVP